MQPGTQEHPWAGAIPARHFHHLGGPEVASHACHLHNVLPVQLAALCHDVVAGGFCPRRHGPKHRKHYEQHKVDTMCDVCEVKYGRWDEERGWNRAACCPNDAKMQLLVYINHCVWLRQLKSAVFSSRLHKFIKPSGLGKYCTVDFFDSLQDLKQRETCCFSCVSTLCG